MIIIIIFKYLFYLHFPHTQTTAKITQKKIFTHSLLCLFVCLCTHQYTHAICCSIAIWLVFFSSSNVVDDDDEHENFFVKKSNFQNQSKKNKRTHTDICKTYGK